MAARNEDLPSIEAEPKACIIRNLRSGVPAAMRRVVCRFPEMPQNPWAAGQGESSNHRYGFRMCAAEWRSSARGGDRLVGRRDLRSHFEDRTLIEGVPSRKAPQPCSGPDRHTDILCCPRRRSRERGLREPVTPPSPLPGASWIVGCSPDCSHSAELRLLGRSPLPATGAQPSRPARQGSGVRSWGARLPPTLRPRALQFHWITHDTDRLDTSTSRILQHLWHPTGCRRPVLPSVWRASRWRCGPPLRRQCRHSARRRVERSWTGAGRPHRAGRGAVRRQGTPTGGRRAEYSDGDGHRTGHFGSHPAGAG